jgi:hypothetical protein
MFDNSYFDNSFRLSSTRFWIMFDKIENAFKGTSTTELCLINVMFDKFSRNKN